MASMSKSKNKAPESVTVAVEQDEEIETSYQKVELLQVCFPLPEIKSDVMTTLYIEGMWYPGQ